MAKAEEAVKLEDRHEALLERRRELEEKLATLEKRPDVRHHAARPTQRQHFEDWVHDPANAETVRRTADIHRGGERKIQRDLNSLHRVYCHE